MIETKARVEAEAVVEAKAEAKPMVCEQEGRSKADHRLDGWNCGERHDRLLSVDWRGCKGKALLGVDGSLNRLRHDLLLRNSCQRRLWASLYSRTLGSVRLRGRNRLSSVRLSRNR